MAATSGNLYDGMWLQLGVPCLQSVFCMAGRTAPIGISPFWVSSPQLLLTVWKVCGINVEPTLIHGYAMLPFAVIVCGGVVVVPEM